MANRAYLIQSSSDVLVEDYDAKQDVLLEATYIIPVFWLACFQLEDITPKREKLTDGTTAVYQYMTTTRGYAIDALKARKTLLFKVLLPGFDREYRLFLKVLENADKEYLHLETVEIWTLMEPKRFKKQLTQSLTAFLEDDPFTKPSFFKRKSTVTKNWKSLLRFANIAPKKLGNISEYDFGYALLGGEWLRDVLWKQNKEE